MKDDFTRKVMLYFYVACGFIVLVHVLWGAAMLYIASHRP